MGLLKREGEYNCYNDCTFLGCPKHKMIVSYHTVTDGIVLEFDDKKYCFDPTTLSLFLELLKNFDRVEIDSIFNKQKGKQ